MTDRALPTSLVSRLRSCYQQPHRRYHDLRHLDAVLAHVDDLATYASEPDAVRLAAWFHDAVYDPARSDNEVASADLARALLTREGIDAGLVTEVGRLVLLTADHRPAPGDRNGEVLCDADLAILGSDPAGYDDYALAVRQEYAHVPEPAFAAGRVRVLRGLLGTRPLFRTVTGAARWERPARANLARELRTLGDAADPPP